MFGSYVQRASAAAAVVAHAAESDARDRIDTPVVVCALETCARRQNTLRRFFGRQGKLQVCFKRVFNSQGKKGEGTELIFTLEESYSEK